MMSQRLRDFLMTWCIPETRPEEVASMLRGPGGAYYRDWLPRELLAAARGMELTPETMSKLTGAAFDDEQVVRYWLRTVWPMWFGEPYPG